MVQIQSPRPLSRFILEDSFFLLLLANFLWPMLCPIPSLPNPSMALGNSISDRWTLRVNADIELWPAMRKR